MIRHYVAVVVFHAGEFWGHIPDLPGVNAANASESRMVALLAEFAADYVRDLAKDGHDVPMARSPDKVPRDPEVVEHGRTSIPVEMP